MAPPQGALGAAGLVSASPAGLRSRLGLGARARLSAFGSRLSARLRLSAQDFGWISLDFGFGLIRLGFWFGLIWLWLDFEWIRIAFDSILV